MSQEQVLNEAVRYARERVGPESASYIATPGAQALLLARLSEGRCVADAVLGVIFRRVRQDRQLANEFFAGLFDDMKINVRSLVVPALRELMESGELVDSVVRDLWEDVGKVEFRTRGQFLSFLLMKTRWKQINSIRMSRRQRRGGDRPAELRSDLHELPDVDSRSPLSQAEHVDDLRKLAKVSAALPKPDRDMLFMHLLDGHTYSEIGQRFGQSPRAAKARIDELMQQLRESF